MAAVGSVYRIRTVCSLPNQIAEQVTHWYVSAIAGTGATDQDIANAADAFFGPITKALLTALATYRGCGVQRINLPPLPVEAVATNQAGVGSLAGDLLPLQVSGLLSLRTPLAGKSNRGRVYLPWPTEGQNGPTGLPNAGYLTLLGSYATTILAPFVAGGGGNTNNLQLVVWSRKLLAKQLVSSIVPNQAWATQRRRGTLGRPNQVPF